MPEQDPLSTKEAEQWAKDAEFTEDETVGCVYGWQECARRARELYTPWVKDSHELAAENLSLSRDWKDRAHFEIERNHVLEQEIKRLREALKYYADYFPRPNIAAAALGGQE